MSIGQVAEILTMAVLGVTLKTPRLADHDDHRDPRLRRRGSPSIAFLPEHMGLIILVNVLHGMCYAFFFATVYIFVDEFFPKDARASAQGLFNLMILGFGPLVANSVGPVLIEQTFNHGGIVDFQVHVPRRLARLSLTRRRRAGAVLPPADAHDRRGAVEGACIDTADADSSQLSAISAISSKIRNGKRSAQGPTFHFIAL